MSDRPSAVPAPRVVRAPSLEERVNALELQLASQARVIEAYERTLNDLSEVFRRAVVRVDAADRGTRLGRPPGSRGTAARPSSIAERDAADLNLSDHSTASGGTPLFPSLRGTDEAIVECLTEAVAGFLVERNSSVEIASSFDLEAHARRHQADLGRGWPFTSAKHFARRLGMVEPQLLALGIRATKFRSTRGKLFWKLEQVAPDGFPIPVGSQVASGESNA